MLKEIKIGFTMLNYSYQLKYNLIVCAIILIVGFVVEYVTKGTNVIGAFYMTLLGMYSYQFIVSMTLSEFIQTTPYKYKLQVTIPSLCSFVIYMITYTLVIIEKHFMMAANPNRYEDYVMGICMLIVFLGCSFIFTAVMYKYFYAGMILFIVMIMFFSSGFSFFWYTGLSEVMCKIGATNLLIAGYFVVMLGCLCQYFVSKALYRVSLSERAFKNMFKDSKKQV